VPCGQAVGTVEAPTVPKAILPTDFFGILINEMTFWDLPKRLKADDGEFGHRVSEKEPVIPARD
jgi:hypothetical protein